MDLQKHLERLLFYWIFLIVCWLSSSFTATTNTSDGSRQSSSNKDLVSPPQIHYVSLAGDLQVPYSLRSEKWKWDEIVGQMGEISLVDLESNQSLVTVDLPVTTLEGNVTFKCGSILSSGIFNIRITINTINHTTESVTSRNPTVEVHWPSFKIIAPVQLETYTTDVTASLESTGIACYPREPVHDTWIELVYYGRNGSSNGQPTTVVSRQFVESIDDYYRVTSRDVILRCVYFDQAGLYRIQLVTDSQNHDLVSVSEVIRVVWSEEYRVRSQASSIFPCDRLQSGFVVFYQHPECILLKDRIRVYGRKRPVTTSPIASPSVFHYVSDRRVEKGHSVVTFPCHLFNETYVEYCFKYLSVARKGAVTEVRSTCVPTYGRYEKTPLDGSWGEWRPWSGCSSTCGHGGTRTRHRLCDSPAPSNNGLFCVGQGAIESQPCPPSNQQPCPQQTTTPSPVDSYTNRMPIGCTCGCTMDALKTSTSRPMYIASDGKRCPNTAKWVIKGLSEASLKFTFLHFDLNDTSECLQVRDGDLLSSELLLHETGRNVPRPVLTSSQVALLRFHSTPSVLDGIVGSGFVVKIEIAHPNLTMIPLPMDAIQQNKLLNNPIHLVATLFCLIIMLVSFSLAIHHFIHNKRRHIDDPMLPSPITSSPGSLQDGYHLFQPVTSTTSLSDVSLKGRRVMRTRRQYKRRKRSLCMSRRTHSPIDSVGSAETSHLSRDGIASPEEYMRDSKIFSSSPSISSGTSPPPPVPPLQRHNSSQRGRRKVHPIVVHKPPLPLTTTTSKSGRTNCCSSQPPLTKQSPLTPGMTRRLPVATVSPQPARILPSKRDENDPKDLKNFEKSTREERVEVDESENKVCPSFSPTTNSTEGEEAGARQESVSNLSEISSSEVDGNQEIPNGRSQGSVTLRPQVRMRNHNREDRRMMASLSEVSLSGTDAEFEYDYYDYGVHNTPGSYFSQFGSSAMSWLPPFLPQPPYDQPNYAMHDFRRSRTDEDEGVSRTQESSADSDTLTISATSDMVEQLSESPLPSTSAKESDNPPSTAPSTTNRSIGHQRKDISG